MKRITNKQKWEKIEALNRYHIYGFYHLEELKKELKKGNETVNVLYELLIKEINQHNAVIKRKVTKLRNTPTID